MLLSESSHITVNKSYTKILNFLSIHFQSIHFKVGIHYATLLLQQCNKVAGNKSHSASRRYLLQATKFVMSNMLPRIDQLFVATTHQRRAACCTQQYSNDTLGNLLPATARNCSHVNSDVLVWCIVFGFQVT